jgi:hypothetical protein
MVGVAVPGTRHGKSSLKVIATQMQKTFINTQENYSTDLGYLEGLSSRNSLGGENGSLV